jgi:hypothetical protein
MPSLMISQLSCMHALLTSSLQNSLAKALTSAIMIK